MLQHTVRGVSIFRKVASSGRVNFVLGAMIESVCVIAVLVLFVQDAVPAISKPQEAASTKVGRISVHNMDKMLRIVCSVYKCD